jgi:hypothetical protein
MKNNVNTSIAIMRKKKQSDNLSKSDNLDRSSMKVKCCTRNPGYRSAEKSAKILNKRPFKGTVS